MILSYYIYFSYRNNECFFGRWFWTIFHGPVLLIADQIVLSDEVSSSLVWLELLNYESHFSQVPQDAVKRH